MKKSTVQVLSFMSGLTIAAVVLGVTISKSEPLRNEIESQLNSVLKTTRSLVDAYKSIASKSKTAVGLINNNPEEKTRGEEKENAEEAAIINAQWDAVETN